jgi:hypothetical protein
MEGNDKNRADINETEKKGGKKRNSTNSWFLGKMDKVHKPIAKMTKKKKKRHKLSRLKKRTGGMA